MTTIRSLLTIVTFYMAGAVSAEAGVIEVVIEKLEFLPETIRAKAGDTIRWVNKDAIAHTATLNSGIEVINPARTSADQHFGESASLDFICRYHPNMRGRIEISP